MPRDWFIESSTPPKGRATTREEKRAVVEELYAAWCAVPALRLGQLVVNALGKDAPERELIGNIFYCEDTKLAEKLKEFALEHEGRTHAHKKDR